MTSDNGPQFVVRDVRGVIRLSCMTHAQTAPYSPQSNGTLEHWNQTRNTITIRPDRPEPPNSLEAARRQIAAFVTTDHTPRLHRAIGSITPADRLAGRSDTIWATRDARLEAARTSRRLAHHAIAA